MAEGDPRKAVLHQVPDPALLIGVPGGELPDNAGSLDALRPEGALDLPHLALVDLRNLQAAMVDVSRDEMDVFGKLQLVRVNAGSACQHHADALRLALHDGIGGNRGAEDDPLQFGRVFVAQKRAGDIQQGADQIPAIGGDLGFLPDPAAIDQNRVRMCSAHIDAQDHSPLPQPENSKSYRLISR